MYLPINVVIADDHEVYRDGLKALLKKITELKVISEAANGRELINICKESPPDIVLTDIMMPEMDGIEATAFITKNIPSIKVIALSMFNQDNLIVDMLKAGAMGYLIKNANKNEIIDAIESVYNNVPYYCNSTSIKLAKLIGSSKFGSGMKEEVQFSEREITIIRMICEEKTTKEIADKLFVSSRTIEENREKIRDKMKVRTSVGMVVYAVREKIFPVKTN